MSGHSAGGRGGGALSREKMDHAYSVLLRRQPAASPPSSSVPSHSPHVKQPHQSLSHPDTKVYASVIAQPLSAPNHDTETHPYYVDLIRTGDGTEGGTPAHTTDDPFDHHHHQQHRHTRSLFLHSDRTSSSRSPQHAPPHSAGDPAVAERGHADALSPRPVRPVSTASRLFHPKKRKATKKVAATTTSTPPGQVAARPTRYESALTSFQSTLLDEAKRRRDRASQERWSSWRVRHQLLARYSAIPAGDAKKVNTVDEDAAPTSGTPAGQRGKAPQHQHRAPEATTAVSRSPPPATSFAGAERATATPPPPPLPPSRFSTTLEEPVTGAAEDTITVHTTADHSEVTIEEARLQVSHPDAPPDEAGRGETPSAADDGMVYSQLPDGDQDQRTEARRAVSSPSLVSFRLRYSALEESRALLSEIRDHYPLLKRCLTPARPLRRTQSPSLSGQRSAVAFSGVTTTADAAVRDGFRALADVNRNEVRTPWTRSPARPRRFRVSFSLPSASSALVVPAAETDCPAQDAFFDPTELIAVQNTAPTAAPETVPTVCEKGEKEGASHAAEDDVVPEVAALTAARATAGYPLYAGNADDIRQAACMVGSFVRSPGQFEADIDRAKRRRRQPQHLSYHSSSGESPEREAAYIPADTSPHLRCVLRQIDDLLRQRLTFDTDDDEEGGRRGHSIQHHRWRERCAPAARDGAPWQPPLVQGLPLSHYYQAKSLIGNRGPPEEEEEEEENSPAHTSTASSETGDVCEERKMEERRERVSATDAHGHVRSTVQTQEEEHQSGTAMSVSDDAVLAALVSFRPTSLHPPRPLCAVTTGHTSLEARSVASQEKKGIQSENCGHTPPPPQLHGVQTRYASDTWWQNKQEAVTDGGVDHPASSTPSVQAVAESVWSAAGHESGTASLPPELAALWRDLSRQS